MPDQTAYLVHNSTGERVRLERTATTLGRSSQNEVVIADLHISRRHTQIQREVDGYWIEDLQTPNGTWVNDKRLTKRTRLWDGDIVRVGSTEYTFKADGEILDTQPATMPETGDSANARRTGTVGKFLRGLKEFSGEMDELPVDVPFEDEKRRSDEIHSETGRMISPARDVDRSESGEPEFTSRPSAEEFVTMPDYDDTDTERASALQRANLDPNPTPHLLLLVTSGSLTGSQFEVDPQGVTMGRGADNAISVPDRMLSRRHVHIYFANGAYWLIDLGTVNGTHVNGEPVMDSRQLDTGDEIHIGETRFVVTVTD